MSPAHSTTPPSEVVTQANGLLTGLGILTFQRFPVALPVLVLVIGPLAVLALPAVVLGAP